MIVVPQHNRRHQALECKFVARQFFAFGALLWNENRCTDAGEGLPACHQGCPPSGLPMGVYLTCKLCPTHGAKHWQRPIMLTVRILYHSVAATPLNEAPPEPLLTQLPMLLSPHQPLLQLLLTHQQQLLLLMTLRNVTRSYLRAPLPTSRMQRLR